MRISPPPKFALVLSFIFSVLLSATFGWIGTLFLNLPGVFIFWALRGSADHVMRLVVFLGDWLFYFVLIWSVLVITRRLRAER
jgi:hypothetical protein